VPSLISEQTANPGTHVLVIGVSAYRHFEDGEEPTHNGDLLEMSQLSAAAHSASEFAGWMLDEYRNERAPLSSLRVLLSPSPGEQINEKVAALLDGDFSATLANVEAQLIEFRAACNSHKDNVAVVYVAGHGVQLTKTGSIVLLHDCGSEAHPTLLKGAVDMAGVHAGFNHPDTAQTQFWFVDACRQEPRIAARFERMDGGLTLDEPAGIAESTAMFIAAVTGTQAFARIGGMTLFSEALLWGLRGGIAALPDEALADSWHVSVLELVKRLPLRVRALAEAEGAQQTVDATGRLNDALFHEYTATPKVDLHLNVLPPDIAANCVGSLRHDRQGFVLQNVAAWPIEQQVDAGIYEVKIDVPNAPNPFTEFCSFRPPAARKEFEFQP
jgi:hypothetical protein